MLAEYLKRQPAPRPVQPAPELSDEERERGNEVLERFKKELAELGT
jgi:cytochrome c553